jgi:hypothetical protein
MESSLKTICYFIVISGFSMLNVHSQYADAGKDTTICKGNKVQIGSASFTPSWCFTWSPDNGTISDKKAPQPEVNPVVTTKYSLRVVGSDFSITDDDDMIVNIIEPKIEFSENQNQKYGFDNYGMNNEVPWKSVKTGDNDSVNAKVLPAKDFKHIFFKSSDISNFSLAPKKALSEVQPISVTGVIKGSAELLANGDEENGINIAKLNVRALNELSKTVAFIQIIEENDDEQIIDVGNGKPDQVAITAGANGILDSTPAVGDTKLGTVITTGPDGICQTTKKGDDIQKINENEGFPNVKCISGGANTFRDTKDVYGDDEIIGEDIFTGPDGMCNTDANFTDLPSNEFNTTAIEHYMNLVYGQSMIKWTAKRLPGCTVNFDLNRDDSLDVSSYWMNPELNAIRIKCGDSSYDKYLFFVLNPSNPKALGIMGLSQPYGYIFTYRGLEVMGNTVSHELGHGLGLHHTYEIDNEFITDPVVKDPENLMHPFLTGERLRKDQWDFLNP